MPFQKPIIKDSKLIIIGPKCIFLSESALNPGKHVTYALDSKSCRFSSHLLTLIMFRLYCLKVKRKNTAVFDTYYFALKFNDSVQHSFDPLK